MATYRETMEEVDRKGGQKTRDAILDMIVQDAKITSTQMAATLGINRSAVSKHLKKELQLAALIVQFTGDEFAIKGLEA